MADGSTIEWLKRPGTKPATWNPVRGCTRVSRGCGAADGGGCYAEVMAARFSDPGQWGHGFAETIRKPDGTSVRRWTGKVALIEEMLTEPLRWRSPRTIFVNSTSDLFHEKLPDEAIDRIFAVMALCPQHTFIVLTKRPERMRAYFAETWQPAPARDVAIGGETIHVEAEKRSGDRWDRISEAIDDLLSDPANRRFFNQNRFWTADGSLIGRPAWPRRPLPNVWLGTSVEDQATYDERSKHLRAAPAAVHFFSMEPLLGPIVADYLGEWTIVGGESGPNARPFNLEWAYAIRNACRDADVPFFMKQAGSRPTWGGYPIEYRSAKGSDPAEWPENLRIRQWPEPRP